MENLQKQVQICEPKIGDVVVYTSKFYSHKNISSTWLVVNLSKDFIFMILLYSDLNYPDGPAGKIFEYNLNDFKSEMTYSSSPNSVLWKKL